MTIIVKPQDLTFYSEPERVEAYRRALEIRQFSAGRNENSTTGRWEHFVWETPTGSGVEVEEVSIDTEEGTVIYRLSEVESLVVRAPCRTEWGRLSSAFFEKFSSTTASTASSAKLTCRGVKACKN